MLGRNRRPRRMDNKLYGMNIEDLKNVEITVHRKLWQKLDNVGNL